MCIFPLLDCRCLTDKSKGTNQTITKCSSWKEESCVSTTVLCAMCMICWSSSIFLSIWQKIKGCWIYSEIVITHEKCGQLLLRICFVSKWLMLRTSRILLTFVKIDINIIQFWSNHNFFFFAKDKLTSRPFYLQQPQDTRKEKLQVLKHWDSLKIVVEVRMKILFIRPMPNWDIILIFSLLSHCSYSSKQL